ncbi:lamin tail domain-containing protein [Janibacter anophelis]|uniref:lamin tail domain-containing protein n=1 Tax=Janibacter anophelis TaxID=319054 RepID=UPI00083726F5|nr:lamin tail domain-containing protein [Janibacter anophelis]
MPSRRRRALAALTLAPFALAGTAVVAPSATAASPDIVIAEAYGGGGNSGATLRSDFVELANRSLEGVDLTRWTLRYYSKSGTTPQTTALSGEVKAGGRYLVQQADGANTSATPLPKPDADGTVSMSSSGARVEVVNPDGQVVDRLAWGGASPAEGVAADSTSNSTSVARTDICADTDNNAVDFTVGAPTPQNSSTPTVVCEPDDEGEPPVDEPETIQQIQGTHHISPLDGTAVNEVEGVVTAVSSSGLWIQSTSPDDDDATSEGLFVYTRSRPSAEVGDTVSVDGYVDEYRPGGSGGWDNLTTTEIVSPTVTVTGTAEVPAPVVLGEDRTAPQQVIDAEDPKNVEYDDAAFRPDRDAIDFYESMEGMQVGVRDAQVVGPTGYEIPVVPGSGVEATRTEAGGVLYSGYDRPNAMRVLVDDVLLPAGSLPDADVRDTLPGIVAGPLDYSFANFKLLATEVPTVQDGGLEREVAPEQHDRELSVAAFNVENLAPNNPQAKFDRLAAQVVTNLRSPDIIAMEEVQDASGSTDDGTVDSKATTDKLIAAIEAAGGPTYEAHWVNPQDKADGGQPGGNIRNVLLHRTDRDIEFVERSSGAADSAAEVVADKKGAHLTESPGRIAPSSPAFEDSRKPLVGEYRYRGERVFVAAVHFSSKGGDDPLFGRWQQPVRFSEDARHEQAREVRAFADDLLAADPEAKFVVAGDVNDFEFSETTDILTDILEGSGSQAMTDLPRTLPEHEQWTYVYDGNSQVLDHILVSPSLATLDGTVNGPWRPGKGKGNRPAFTYDIVHTNSPFADQDSDHDPQVVHLDLKK